MKAIKFSHIYSKMNCDSEGKPPEKALLKEVFVKDSKDLHPRFVESDTSYVDKEGVWCYYKLPQGKVIILLLESTTCGMAYLWTTIRRYTPNKYEYYQNHRWHEFNIIIEEENERQDDST